MMTPAAVNAHRWWRWAIAAAASLLFMFALAASYLQVRDVPPPEQAQRGPDIRPNPVKTGPSMSLEDTSQLEPLPIKARGSSTRHPALQFAARRVGRAALDGNTDLNSSSNARESGTVASSGDAEIATEFLPLVDESNLRTMDVGLPMNAERVSERVKADVLLGNDGLARAVRFVR
jgi:hypothetical protein